MKPQALYRHFDLSGALLYVGVTNRIPNRIKEHSKHSSWWSQIARIDIEHFPDRESVLKAEREAIINEKPKHNIQHACRLVPDQQATIQPNAKSSIGGKLTKSQDAITARLVNLRPLYTIQQASELLGVSSTMLRAEYLRDHLNFIDIPNPRSEGTTQYVTGWALLDWIENLEQSAL